MEQRINFVIDVFEDNNVHTAILGAWGCGAFMQNPEVVSRQFKKRLEKTSIKRVIFAIPGKNANYFAFEKVFG